MITAAIPTYMRGEIAAVTVQRLFALTPPPDAILVIDRSPVSHPDLVRWSDEGHIRLIRLDAPSIPKAMNAALLAAATPLVLFLDDDIEPSPSLVGAHVSAHGRHAAAAVVGQILQPGEAEESHPRPADDLEFRFNGAAGAFVTNVMAGNLSVDVARALAAGGFDENFVGVAYRFETDFALRLTAAGGMIWFEPSATLRHLKLASGGLRAYGDHHTSSSPMHSVGDYYFALHHAQRFWRYAFGRLRKNVVTRFHLRHPWTVPGKLLGEVRGLLLARRLARSGRKLLQPEFLNQTDR
jgi:GT2 family glycosyltransferase